MLAIESIDIRRKAIALATPAKHKTQFGQFMTPGVIANFMASMFHPLGSKTIRLLDAGAGIGSLTAAVAQRAAIENAVSLECEAWEIDPKLQDPLLATLEACKNLVVSSGLTFKAKTYFEDFILSFSSRKGEEEKTRPTHAILNPPYKKISSASDHRLALRDSGIETTNLYSAFVALALSLLADEGELVAITPRSFCNGTYFRPFREFLLSRAAIVQIHVFESRTHAFKGDEVLQENVIFHLVKGAPQGNVLISTSADASFSETTSQSIPFDNIVLSKDREKIFHLEAAKDDSATNEALKQYCHSLDDLGLSVSTGPVVDFRLREHLREENGSECAPLIYAHHFENGFVTHPKQNAKKPNYIQLNSETLKWMKPIGCYVCVRRLSSKEEKRRIIPAVFTPASAHGEIIGFDNHMNYFHKAKAGMPEDVAKGLAVYLGSTFADQWLRRFSGHTQVNAGDLRALRYPDIQTLTGWGKNIDAELPSQKEIDRIVGGIIVKD